jgi:hypothetical protein
MTINSISLDELALRVEEIFDAVMRGEYIRITGTGAREGQVAKLSPVVTGREELDAEIDDWTWADMELVHQAWADVWRDGCPSCRHQTTIPWT